MADRVRVVQTSTDPTLVVANVTFDSSGDASVTASSLGLGVINGFAACPMGGTTNAVAAIYSDTAFAAAGVTTVSLECRESDGGTDADLEVTTSILF